MISDLGMTSSRRCLLVDAGTSDDDAAWPGSAGAAGTGIAGPSAGTGVVMP
jgi:hypothetical protein